MDDWKGFKTNPATWTLNDFDMKETLGTGTFGRVRLSKLKSEDKYIAVKVLKKEKILKMKQLEHLMSERNILAEISHPFVVNLLQTCKDTKNLYMLMEYVRGGELFSHLRRAGKFPNDVAKFYAAEIVLAFEYLHSKHIIYRDLKPENLLLDSEGHIKITDFGFAKRVPDRTFTLCGTPEYLAPEIIQSKGHGKAVDWWALGILIYEMIVGYPPFFDESPFRIYEKILDGKLEFPRFMESSAKDLIKKLLVTDKTKRLGALKNGALDIKNHKWFRGVDWDQIMNRQITPPIPIRADPDSSRYFEKYPDSIDDLSGPRLTQDQHALFDEF